jgi:HEXXH motif-containing protein
MSSACPAPAPDLVDIDWARTVRPQQDGYDLAILARLLSDDRPPWLPVGARIDAPPPAGFPCLEGSRTAIGFAGAPLIVQPPFVAVEGIPPALAAAVGLVRRWPEMAAQWPRIVNTIQPYTDPTAAPGRLGSCSHNEAWRFGAIALTADCALGAAQAIVHETAHHKLRALGVDNEQAVRIIRNPAADLFPSPVVGCPRPMTALLHAHYSFMHVLELDLRMLDGEEDPGRRRDIVTLLRRNAVRLAESGETIRRHADTDEAGAPFVGELLRWTDEALGASVAHLRDRADAEG